MRNIFTKMAYIFTTACKKISELRQRVRGICGGTSAGKTIAVLLWLIDYAQTHKKEMISIVSESFPHLKRGAIRDFLMIMEEHGYFDALAWNKTDFIYSFANGSRIEFFSADQPAKVRGPRRQVLFINEANNIDFETYTQLEIRTEKIIILDWNPVTEFWWYTDVAPAIAHDFITLTYRDNEALSANIIESIESKKSNARWFRVYGEGQLGEAEERIFTGWEMIDEVPFGARLERYGLDFGYTNDPTAIVAVYYYNGAYILDQKMYLKGQSNKTIADLFLSLPDKSLVIADSSEPKSIDEIASFGVAIVGTVKGADSVRHGISLVKQHKIQITKRSLDVIKEYRNYIYEKDRNGKLIAPETPVSGNDHAMDAIRYAFSSIAPQQYRQIKITDNRVLDTSTW